MRRPLIGGNWKMNTTLSDASVLATAVKNGVAELEGVEVVLFPPFVWLYPVFEIIEKGPSFLTLGAQNMHFLDEGAYTGEISPLMLKNMCQYVILGHSERRTYFNEKNELINDKIQAALKHTIAPVICLGEYKKEEKVGATNDVLKDMRAVLKAVPKEIVKKAVLVYEPVWAIGTGKPASGVYAASMVLQMRQTLAKMYNLETASQIRILYGGSVTADNILEFTSQREIDGALVGGASLKAKEFMAICRRVAGRKEK